MTEISEIIKLFKEKPYLIRMGAGKIGKQYKLDPDRVREARNFLKRGAQGLDKPKGPLKILIFDIETSPLKAYVWSRWKQNIYLDQTISEWFMICWSAKWLGDDDIMSDCISPSEIAREDDGRIIKRLWSLIDEADIIIGHNSKRFDTPKMNSRFILHGLPPTSPYKQIDTKEVAAKQFGFSSNKLDALAGYFGIPHKDKTEFQLWVDCLNGDQKALDYMLRYNEKDVFILEEVYLKLRPWIRNHPNVAIYLEMDKMACASCGSTNVSEDNSFYYTNVNKYKMYRCNCCSSISRVRNTSYPKNIKNNLLVPTS